MSIPTQHSNPADIHLMPVHDGWALLHPDAQAANELFTPGEQSSPRARAPRTTGRMGPLRVKQDVHELALFGGTPAFQQALHVGRPNVGDRDYFMQRVEAILDSRWFTNNGQCVQDLESEVARYLDVKHCIAVCNATVGLELAIRALGLRGEVIVPSMTFIATAHALQWQRIRPVFCDIDPHTHSIDPQAIEALITPATTGILGVHLWGIGCEVEALETIADKHGLKLLFDAAHAFGCTHAGRRVGSFGAAEVFSFHATKFFNSFEGGAITTNDDELAGRLRQMRNFGFASFDNVVHVGTNGKMSEVCAAMGLASLRGLERFLEINITHHRHYSERLNALPGLHVLQYPAGEAHNHQYVGATYRPEPGMLSRDELIRVLWAENIMARKYFYPGCHRMEPYRTLDPQAGLRLPHTEAVAAQLLILPTGTGVSPADVAAVCDLVELALTRSSAISTWLAQPS